MECHYCEESNEYIILIPKPRYFYFKNENYINVQAFSKQDMICLKCLEEELELLKDN